MQPRCGSCLPRRVPHEDGRMPTALLPHIVELEIVDALSASHPREQAWPRATGRTGRGAEDGRRVLNFFKIWQGWARIC